MASFVVLEEVGPVQKALNKKDARSRLPRVIAITSGKGGVGKSSISVNLGISLAKKGARVCLLDADTGLANANILLGLTPEYSLEHVLYGAKPIEEIMLDGPHGMKIVPGANGISECVALHPRQHLRLTRELARIETDFDYILIDTAAGISDTTLNFVSAAHHTMIVITPEPTSLTDAFSLIKLLKRRRSSIHYHVVVNMCSSAGQAKEVFRRFNAAVEKYIGVKSHFLGYLLRDESMRAAVELQNPVAMFPDSDPSSRGFVRLANSVAEATGGEVVTSTFSAFWHRQFREQRNSEEADKVAKAAPLPEPSAAENRDSDYLSELRSRMLLLIEQGHAGEEKIKTMLQESISAYIKRFDHSPVDTLSIIDQLVQTPVRDEQLLKDIAERVNVWSSLIAAVPPTGEMMGRVSEDEASSVEEPAEQTADHPEVAQNVSKQLHTDVQANSVQSGHLDLKSPNVQQPQLAAVEAKVTRLKQPASQSLPKESLQSAKITPIQSVADGEQGSVNHSPASHDETAVAANLGIHHYDAARFGSQQSLVDILRRQTAGGQSTADLLCGLM